MIRRTIFSLLMLVLILALSACGGATTPPPPEATAQPAEEAPPPTDPPPTEEEVPPVEQPAETPVPPPDPFDPVAAIVYERAQNIDLVEATLFRLFAQSFDGGVQMVFQFQDSVEETTVFCTGYAVTVPDADAAYTLNDISVACSAELPDDPITAFTTRNPTALVGPEGQTVRVVFGEVYSADVVAVRVFDTDGSNVPATISGGGWLALLDAETDIDRVVAYDAAGETIFEGGLTSRPGQQ